MAYPLNPIRLDVRSHSPPQKARSHSPPQNTRSHSLFLSYSILFAVKS
ncbi:MAG: hypothetical protein RIG63_01830 [Coleofasciculus chthonoplastes F3-SA18-01]